jgi:phytoene desaturase
VGNISVIGSGFAGLSSACHAASAGHAVTVFEKNGVAGGRARVLRENGFVFDMGPSWYWMPEVYERFFRDNGERLTDHLDLVRLSPAFQVVFGKGDVVVVPDGEAEVRALFDSIEPGSGARLQRVLAEGASIYDLALARLMYSPALSWKEFLTRDVISAALRLSVLSPMSSAIRKNFRDPRLRLLMEFPLIFLGARAGRIPSLYKLMHHAAFNKGTWYPMGGMGKVTEAMEKVAAARGVTFHFNAPVNRMHVDRSRIWALDTDRGSFSTDAVIASADYQHVEQKLLPRENRNYPASYWDQKQLAPSCLIFYLGISGKVPHLIHHNLFFDADFDAHTRAVFQNPEWPDDPLFYVCCPSKTDPSTAPVGCENLFVLIPLASGLEDRRDLHDVYFKKVMSRLEAHCGQTIADKVIYRKDYCLDDFRSDYNAYKGNAYGLASTLRQTAVFRPSSVNRSVLNLFYSGQLTVPGPGVPPALISGSIAARQAHAYLNSNHSLK